MVGETERGTPDVGFGKDGLEARREMQSGLLRSFLWLITFAAAALTLRELTAQSPVLAALLATALGLTGLLWSHRRAAPLRALGLAFFCVMVLLITKAALDLGGAAGSAL